MVIGDKKGGTHRLFNNFSLGVVTNRDAWCYNPSKANVEEAMESMIGFYNEEANRFSKEYSHIEKKEKAKKVDGFINTDATKISWTRSLKQELAKDRRFEFDRRNLIQSLYRPFTKQWLYYNRRFNEMVYQMPRIFPDTETMNKVISVSGIGARSGFSTLM